MLTGGAVPSTPSLAAAWVPLLHRKIPAIAFSADIPANTPWNQHPRPIWPQIYADLAMVVINELLENQQKRRKRNIILPHQIWLNVVLPALSDKCQKVEDFKFTLTRSHRKGMFLGLFTPDIRHCGGLVFPEERHALRRDDCFVPITPLDARSRKDYKQL